MRGLESREHLQVISGLLEEKLRVCMRRIEVTVVNRPRAKTAISASFWLLGSCEVQMGCIGSAKMITSVAIEKAALAYQLAVMLIQVPGMDLSHALGTGVHCHMEDAVVAIM